MNIFKHYYEPFVGGGALFFHLRSSGVLLDHDITLSDINLRLIRKLFREKREWKH